MVKKRVYELAKEFGVDSKTVLERLKSMGEFVKSASSTVEARNNVTWPRALALPQTEENTEW